MIKYPEKTPSDLEKHFHLTKRTYHKGDCLTFTLNPDDTHQHFCQDRRLNNFYKQFRDAFQEIFKDSDRFAYWVKIEISEPIGAMAGNGPRLHLHGFIKLHTNYAVCSFLTNCLPELLHYGRVKINHANDVNKFDGWHTYCNKQNDIIPTNTVISNITDDYVTDTLRPKGIIE